MIIYIDFDGVIYDTVTIILKKINDKKINLKNDCTDFFSNLNWREILNTAKEINNSISSIKKLQQFYNIKILTHVSSITEMEEKTKFIKEKLPDIEIIFVPKSIMKSQIAIPKNNMLIDDSYKNVDDWKENEGVGILFDKTTHKNLEEIININKG